MIILFYELLNINSLRKLEILNFICIVFYINRNLVKKLTLIIVNKLFKYLLDRE